MTELSYQIDLIRFSEFSKSDSGEKSDAFCMIRIVESDFIQILPVQTFRLIQSDLKQSN